MIDAWDGPVGIVCGGGSLPAAVAQGAQSRGRPVVLFAIRGWADPAFVDRFAHHWIGIGQAGRFIRLAAKERCRDIVFIGNVLRPALSEVRLDWRTLWLLPRIARLFRGGDDHLISGVAAFLEDHGFRLVAAHAVAPEILAAEGPIGRRKPCTRDLADAAVGLRLLHAIGPFDIGQAAVVIGRHVVAVEAAEGTDGVLARVVELRRNGRLRTPVGAGVLVKAAKPAQDRRFDLPSIGPRTVAEVARAGLAGVAVVAGEAIVAEPHLVAAAADRAKIFVSGVLRTGMGEGLGEAG